MKLFRPALLKSGLRVPQNFLLSAGEILKNIEYVSGDDIPERQEVGG